MATTIQPPELASRYDERGYAFPLPVLDAAESQRLAAVVERYAKDEATARYLRGDAHLVFRFVDELTRNERVLDAVEAAIGPDIMLLRAGFFMKPPHSTGHVTWHQDLTYWGLDRPEEVTAWIALTPVTEANGCMRFVPGSHRQGIVEHVDSDDRENFLTRGQSIAVPVQESDSVSVVLAPGEMSLHHGQIFHASGPNNTDGWRIGLAARYVTPSTKQVVGSKDFAISVRGEDHYRNFEQPPRPATDLDENGIAFYNAAAEAKKEYLYQEKA